jgi:transcriptional regulator with XRE-family HTH domain
MAKKTPTPLEELARNIRVARVRANMNQDEVGYKLGISGKTYSSHERGRSRLTIDQLLQLPAIFNCSIADLLPSSVVTAVDQRRSKDLRLEEIIDIWHELGNNERGREHLLEAFRLARETTRLGRERAFVSSLKHDSGTPPVDATEKPSRTPFDRGRQ